MPNGASSREPQIPHSCPHCGEDQHDGRVHGRQVENGPVRCLPEDNVDWNQRFPGRCHFYPMRDCPGCVHSCARGFGNILKARESEEIHPGIGDFWKDNEAMKDFMHDKGLSHVSEAEQTRDRISSPCPHCGGDQHDGRMHGREREYGPVVCEPAEPQHFRSCPACRGSGKLDMRCAICEGRGSVSTDSEGRMDASVTDGAKHLLEAARVAVLPTAEFERMKANFQNEAIEWVLRWLTMRAKNMQATQDYVGEHRLNAAVTLMRNDWKELADE